MRTALDDMTNAASKYKAVCTSHGISEKAMKLDKLGKAITGGWTSSLEMAVDDLGGQMPGGKAVELVVELGKAEVKAEAESL